MKTKHVHKYRVGKSVDVCDCGAFKHKENSVPIVERPCACSVTVWGEMGNYKVNHCPLHKAAPEMLAALKLALPVYESVYLDFCEKDDKELENNFFENLEKIKAAIAKATGEQP